MKRRSFLKAASISALASSVSFSFYHEETSIPIIDTHQHLWDLNLIPLTWVKPPLDNSFLTKDYLKAVKGQNVVKAIYMEVGAPPEYKKKEARMALELCENPSSLTVGAVISADPTDPEFKSYINSFDGSHYLKGIRYPFNTSETMLLPAVLSNINFLGAVGLRFDLNLSPHLLSEAPRLLDACPETQFILNHCGNADPVAFFPKHKVAPREPRHNPDQWHRAIETISTRNNVICKISGIVDNAPNYPLSASDLAPIINHCLDSFGPDRVIFASDWPVCTRSMSLAAWIDIVKEVIANRSQVDQRKLFHDNAYSFYGLKD